MGFIPPTNYYFQIGRQNFQWSRQDLQTKLQNLAVANKSQNWILSNLEVVPSSESGRFFWTFVQYFQCLRTLFYKINHKRSNLFLNLIKQQIEKDDQMMRLFLDAINNYNLIVSAPNHVSPTYSLQFLSNFYRGIGRDVHGRTLQDLWNISSTVVDPVTGYDLPNDNKESNHWFIQWLFPLKTPSGAQPGARGPVLDDATYAFLSQDPLVISNMRKSFQEMLCYYGLKYNETTKIVERRTDQDGGYSFQAQEQAIWTTGRLGHNLLRMTRMLQSLISFGLKDEAKAFLDALVQIKREHDDWIPDNTINKFWITSVPGYVIPPPKIS